MVCLLCHEINEKLVTEMRLLIARNFDNELWDLSEMLRVLKHKVKTREHSVSVGVSYFERHEKIAYKGRFFTCTLNSSLQRGDKNSTY